MADIRLIATDLDGTFLMNGEEPHPDNMAALKRCQEAGIVFCVCTGRMWYEAKQIVADCGFRDFCVTSNGASIIDIESGEHRFRSRIDPTYLRQILQVAVDYKADICINGSDSLYFYRPLMNERDLDWVKMLENRPEEFRVKTYIMDTVNDLFEVSKYHAEKINLNINIVKYLDEVYEKLSAITEVEITSAWLHGMEITSKGSTKAEALSVIADIYEIDHDNIMALGDGFNDISMLMLAGTGVAMGNADDRLKSIADYVTSPNYEGGVAKAINEIVFV